MVSIIFVNFLKKRSYEYFLKQGTSSNFLKMFLMYKQWLPTLVHIIVHHFCLLIKKPDLPKLENNFSMMNDEALTRTL